MAEVSQSECYNENVSLLRTYLLVLKFENGHFQFVFGSLHYSLGSVFPEVSKEPRCQTCVAV